VAARHGLRRALGDAVLRAVGQAVHRAVHRVVDRVVWHGCATLTSALTSTLGGARDGGQLQLSADYSWAATPIWRLAIGGSITAVDDDHAQDRFGISAPESAASGLAAYEPSGGIQDAGIALRSILSFSPRYGVFTRIAYTRLLDEAADSPLVERAGTADQWFNGAGLFISFGR